MKKRHEVRLDAGETLPENTETDFVFTDVDCRIGGTCCTQRMHVI